MLLCGCLIISRESHKVRKERCEKEPLYKEKVTRQCCWGIPEREVGQNIKGALCEYVCDLCSGSISLLTA